MKVLFTLAWRNLWRNKRRTLITVSSVLFAVMLASALLSFAGGYQGQLVETMVRQETGYLQIQDVQYMDEPSLDHTFEYGEGIKEALRPFEEEIKYTVPRIQGFSLAAKEMSTKPAMVSGIDPESEEKLRGFNKNLVEGAMFSPEDNFAVIGQGLAELLGISLEDTLVLIGQGFQAMTATGKFKVGGILEFSLPEQNNTMVFLPLKEAQWYFAAENRLTNLIIMPEDEEEFERLARDIREKLDDEWVTARTWKELMPDMVGLMQMQSTVYRVIAWVFYIIVGFGIFGTILTMLYERMREFGILLSLGMKRLQLALVGLIETIIIGIMGVIAGVVGAFPILYFLYHNPIRLSGDMADYMLDMGMEPVMPFSISPDIFLYQAVSIFLITLFIGLFAMHIIFKINILEAARN